MKAKQTQIHHCNFKWNSMRQHSWQRYAKDDWSFNRLSVKILPLLWCDNMWIIFGIWSVILGETQNVHSIQMSCKRHRCDGYISKSHNVPSWVWWHHSKENVKCCVCFSIIVKKDGSESFHSFYSLVLWIFLFSVHVKWSRKIYFPFVIQSWNWIAFGFSLIFACYLTTLK